MVVYPNMNQPKKILIIRTDRLGDVILSTPVIENLRRAFPNIHLSFMCQPYTKDVLVGNPYLDQVIVYDKYGTEKSFWTTVKFALKLRKEKFDWAIVLHPTNRAHIIAFLAGIPLRVGWDRKYAFFLSKKIPHDKQKGQKHEVEYTLDVLRALHISIDSKKLFFPLDEKSEVKIQSLLLGQRVEEKEDFFVIHPSASCPSKRWPQDHFLQLIKLLQEKFKIKIILIGSESEKKFSNQLASHEGVVDLRGKLTLKETAALLKRAKLFISNDSGPVHIAAALNTPVISIFGRKNPGLSPARWRPLGEKSIYLHKDVGCLICLAHNCQKNFFCLQAITAEEVVEKISNLTL